MTDFSGKTYLVVGASGALGSRVAQALAARGAALTVTGRSAEALAAFDGAHVVTADLRDPDAGRSVVAAAVEHGEVPLELGAPQIVDVNVPVFDITTGDTVLANVVTGGNPDLLAETQRDIRLSASYDFDLFDRSNFRVEYVRNRSEDVTESFPVLTPAIEAAFPDRVTRVNGQLVELDRRPVTFAERNSSRIQYGFNFFGKVGKPAPQSEGGGRRGGLMARVGAAAGQASTPGQAREGQGRGGFDTERFAQIRAQFCQEGTEPDIAQLPERMQQRLRDENGQIDPARVAQMRERICSAD
ncbi:NAD-dependent epimerase/dehydratase family protein, partial [Mycolicibacterium poriferae]|uniref:NAD-dependent epimerase/dehydratase family protein n=1 Tax=Mycolicibacterium poriferae TaxID=39694 RepID=UPI0032175B24